MLKQSTSVVTLIFLMMGIMSNAFESNATPVSATSKKLANAIQTNKTHNELPSSHFSEDIVVDELIMIRLTSNANYRLGSTQKKQAKESLKISVGNTVQWRAAFRVGGQKADIALSYDVQTDRLSFDKVLGSDITYKVDPNGTFIDFYVNNEPFFSIADMKTCDNNMCATINFSMNNTVLSLYDAIANNEASASTAQGDTENQPTGGIVNMALKNTNKALISAHQASPSPFANNATIKYNLANDATVRVAIYNSLGQQISVLASQSQAKGVNTIEWQTTTTQKAGIYFYEITANNERMVGKLIKE
jgi:Secretion system C-terminal sorting domain